MFGERIWVVIDLYVLTIFLLCGSYLLSDLDHRNWSSIVATILSGVAVISGIAFRKGLWNLANRWGPREPGLSLDAAREP